MDVARENEISLNPAPRTLSVTPTIWSVSELTAGALNQSTSAFWRRIVVAWLFEHVALRVPDADGERGATGLFTLTGEDYPRSPRLTIDVSELTAARVQREMQRYLEV